MAKGKPAPTLADYVVQAITPALIIALVSSLIFFLLEILYNGIYSSNLTWLMFLFVLGAVLIARISMNPSISDRATGYGLALGAVVYLALGQYVDYNDSEWAWAINLGLIGLIWWCAHRLTRDSTHINEDEESTGEGALQAAGLEEAPPESEPDQPSGSWLDQHRAEREKQRRKRKLGVWVVYFSLAALPIFGLGQSLIPVEDTDRRRYVFWLMGIYLASGLGLLMATTFLSLRKYLRHRKIRMPASIVGTWLAIGTALSLGLLLLGAFLPRPRSEYPLFEVGQVGSEQKEASDESMNDGGAGKDDSEGSTKNRNGEQNDNSKGPGNEGKPGKTGSARGANSGASSGEKGQKAGGKQRGDNQSQGKDSQQGKGNQRSSDEDGRGEKNKPGREKSSSSSELWEKLAEILKWIVLGIIALICLFFFLRGALGFFSNFSSWAKRMVEAWNRFWARIRAFLFGGSAGEVEVEAIREEVTPPMPFASFSNPFHTGRAHRMSVENLVRYTFAALQAWAVEQNLARQPGETALEHADRIGQEHPEIQKDVRRLALLYARVTYGRTDLPASGRKTAEKVWEDVLSMNQSPVAV